VYVILVVYVGIGRGFDYIWMGSPNTVKRIVAQMSTPKMEPWRHLVKEG